MNLKEKANEIKKDISALFIAMKKKETPWYAKLIAGIAVTYALSPIDLIPDFIPILGYLDDLLILPLLITLAVKLIPPDVMEMCKVEAEGLWKNGKPKHWYYAIPVILLWVLLSIFICNIIW